MRVSSQLGDLGLDWIDLRLRGANSGVRGVCAGGASGSQSEQYRSAGRSAGQSRWKRTKGQLLRRPIAGGGTAFAGGEWLTDNTVGSAYVADVRLVQTEE